MSKGTLIRKEIVDLGIAIQANLVSTGLPDDVVDYFLANKQEIPDALRRGFSLKQEQEKVITQVVPVGFKLSDTDLATNLLHAEAFAKKHFGLEVKLEDIFQFPDILPWQSVLPIFVPAWIDKRKAVDLLSKVTGKKAFEEEDVMKYSGSEASIKHRLFLIQNSLIPDKETMVGMSPNQLMRTEKSWLSLLGYALAMALRKEIDGLILDRKTFTWFPENRLSTGKVANGNWYSDSRQAGFNWNGADDGDDDGGARSAVACPLKL